MNTKQLKELYATGEWICVCRANDKDSWDVLYKPNFTSILQHKLIHKKHSEVLDHVLSGGEFKCTYSNRSTPNVFEYYADSFMKIYDESNTYEIIKDKPKKILVEAPNIDIEGISKELRGEPDLSGHYCLATKEHYDKLINDGYIFVERWFDDKIYLVDEEKHVYTSNSNITHNKPMHLHNNKWVFGSLEHVNDIDVVDIPKQVERITREEAKDEYVGWYIDDIIDKLFDYIEYLEANQKEDK